MNVVRAVYEPVALVTALAPRIADVPGNIKAAVLQFLIVIVPHAGQYFSQGDPTSDQRGGECILTLLSATGHNLGAFLSRLSHVLSVSAGAKPSIALLSSGSRLIELVFKAAPQAMLAQVAVLPMLQQLAIRKMLEAAVPDFDFLLLSANGRSEIR